MGLQVAIHERAGDGSSVKATDAFDVRCCGVSHVSSTRFSFLSLFLGFFLVFYVLFFGFAMHALRAALVLYDVYNG